jgi:hypothetical protein
VPVNDTYLEESSLVDITSSVVEGELSFQPLGSGDWQIMAFYERYTNQKSCTGAPNPDTIIANGSWIVDHFSDIGAKVTTDFIDQNVLDSNNQKALNKIGQYGELSCPSFVSNFNNRHSMGRQHGNDSHRLVDTRLLDGIRSSTKLQPF